MDQKKLFQIFGTENLVNLFNDLDKENQTKILNTSFRKASKLIIDQAKNNLRGSYKHVSDSLKAQARNDINVMNVGTVKKLGGQLASISNSGTKERFTKSGYKRGRIKANYFWDNAIEGTEKQVEETIFKDIKDRFEKLVQKNIKM